ncbi:hypothetical protein M9434_000459 [Picochlorum sp. BPE23]|nr:hypothetical protein M9434_000459 [Picochlorum sp. BPE23]
MRRGFASTGIQLQQQEEKAEDEQDTKGPATVHALSLPETLEYHGTPSVPTVPDDASIFKKAVLWMGGYYSKQSTYMRAAGELNVCIKEQSLNPALFQELEVPNDFQHTHALLCLHVWLIIKRLSLEGKPGKRISQIMYDNFQDDVEHMVREAGVQVRLQKHLTELEKQFYGSSAAYDKALDASSQETLAAALHRNVYQQDPAKKNASKKMETYVLRAMASLSKTPSDIVLKGQIRFSK